MARTDDAPPSAAPARTSAGSSGSTMEESLAIAIGERDSFQQEMFESGRYAASLTRELHASRGEIAELQVYIGILEARLWDNETVRLALASELDEWRNLADQPDADNG